MEESSEPNMETDVSSTTEDVPETQEVTGSNGSVEMVIVVEKVKEEEMNSEVQNEIETSLMDNNINEVSKPSVESPQMDTEVQIISLKSPTKHTEAESSSKTEPTQEPEKKDLELDNEIEVSAQLEETENVDSSVKENLQIDNTNKSKSLESSPEKVQNKTISLVESSPNKVQNTTISLIERSPSKVQNTTISLTESSPNRVQNKTISLVESSPNKVQNTTISLIERNPSKVQNTKISLTESSPNRVQNTTISLIESSPTRVQNKTVSLVENSPSKVNNKTISLVESSPNKAQNRYVENSPIKEAPKPIEVLPHNELQINEPTTSTSTNEPLLVEKFLINGKIQNNDRNDDTLCKTTSSIMPIDITIERDTSDDSQIETNSIETNCSDTSEKEHNKSISRELKSLINSAKESKIISECTQLKSKTRKSRLALDNSSTSLNTSVEAEKVQGRRHSNNSQKSNCSEKSEKVAVKRSMRSQNPEFVSKVKQFLNSVTGKGNRDKDSDEEYEEAEEKNSKDKGLSKDKNYHVESSVTPPKIKKVESVCSEASDSSGKLRSDFYCWRCHWVIEPSTPMPCTVCPRSFHLKCLSSSERNKINAEKSWVCPECVLILQAESPETRSPAMKKISPEMLCELLKYALERLMDLNGVEPFLQPVDRTNFPDYDKYVVHPMDLSLMQNNITNGVYGSTVAFLSDAQWILRNSIIFNTLYPTVHSKLTAGARALVRACRAELGEIEACAQCYAAAHARRPTWFTDVCTTPHILLWAKLKGFPYWPAKGMSVSSAGHVDVRFFGAHDRAWVPAKDCYLYSEKDPNNFRTKRQDIIDSMHEAEQHIGNISKKYGKFVYPPFKTQFNPAKLNEQLKMMIPSFVGEVGTSLKVKSSTLPADTKEKSRSNSKSSKSSYNDGDISENEDVNETEHSTTVALRKMADGAEIAREDEDTTSEKPEIMDVDTTSKVNESGSQKLKSTELLSQSNKTSEPSRKRRRSDLEEAVIIIESSNNPPEHKRKKHENKQEKEKKKSEESEPSSSKEGSYRRTDKSKKSIDKLNDEVQGKDNEPSSSTKSDSDKEKNQRVTPIRIALVQKDRRHNLRTNTAKEAMAKILNPTREKDRDRDHERNTPTKQKHCKTEKNGDKTPKEDKLTRSEKRRNSRNKSINNTPKSDKSRRTSAEKKSEKTAKSENEIISYIINKEKSKEIKDTSKESSSSSKENNAEIEMLSKDNIISTKSNAEIVPSVKDRLHFDDDTSLAVIARESRTVIISNNTSGLPTISCVRSLSTTAQNTGFPFTKSTTNAGTSDGATATSSDSCLLIPTSTESVKDASKLQRLRNDAEPMVGRVGVRAFARMTSPDKSPNNNDHVEIEIKAEPIDVDDAERQVEKLNLMNAFRLRPVNPPVAAANLREVRINKVLVTPLNAKKTTVPGPKPAEIRPRAKKTFPQPKKPEDGQLNSKNSMVYIPIQPPMTQAPIRPQRILTGACLPKPPMSSSTSIISQVNTVTTPVMQVAAIASSPSTSAITSTPSKAMATLGPVPSSVHTVPMMTSVNGQWMFSFQPVMSVGALDTSPSAPILNGVAERNNSATSLISLPSSATQNNQQLQVSLGQGGSVQTTRPATSKTPGENNTPGEPPRLQQRPALLLMNPLDPNAPVGNLPTPSSAGPLTAKLNQNAVKLTDFFRALLEDSLEKLDEPATQLATARLQLEQAKWNHQTEIGEIKHNQELTIAEMRALFEKEKLRAVAEARRAAQLEMEAAVKLAKSKQWCANCSQEAQFYCCWNTSYCDYPCQRAHWSQHFNVCAQQRQEGSNANEPPAPTETRLQSQPDNMPVLQKNSTAPALTVGGKLAPSRVYTQDQHNVNSQKNAIIVSMVEDQSGNQTMKCLGTYKSPAPAQNLSPIILNKQIMNNEENANNKKVVSSGGYLIVGGGSNSSAVVTPTRRTHTIQYFS